MIIAWNGALTVVTEIVDQSDDIDGGRNECLDQYLNDRVFEGVALDYLGNGYEGTCAGKHRFLETAGFAPRSAT